MNSGVQEAAKGPSVVFFIACEKKAAFVGAFDFGQPLWRHSDATDLQIRHLKDAFNVADNLCCPAFFKTNKKCAKMTKKTKKKQVLA